MSWKRFNARRDRFAKSLKKMVRRFITNSSYDGKRLMFDSENSKYLGSFVISSKAFEGFKNVTNVSSSLPALVSGDGQRRIYMVLDVFWQHGIDWGNYRDALVKCFGRHYEKGMEVCIKFHFDDKQRAAHFAELVTLMAGVPLQLLDASYSIEDALKRDDIIIFGLSSLGYYASLLGCECYSFCSLIDGFDLDGPISKGVLPECFRELAVLG